MNLHAVREILVSRWIAVSIVLFSLGFASLANAQSSLTVGMNSDDDGDGLVAVPVVFQNDGTVFQVGAEIQFDPALNVNMVICPVPNGIGDPATVNCPQEPSNPFFVDAISQEQPLPDGALIVIQFDVSETPPGQYLVGFEVARAFDANGDNLPLNTDNGGVSVSDACASDDFRVDPEVLPNNIPAEGGGANFALDLVRSCEFTIVVTDPERINFGPQSGSDSIVVEYEVGPNPDPEERTEIFRIIHEGAQVATHTFVQDAAPQGGCSASDFEVSPGQGPLIPGAGGEGGFELSVRVPGCDWTAVPSANRITVDPASGSDSAGISYFVGENQLPSQRSEVIRIVHEGAVVASHSFAQGPGEAPPPPAGNPFVRVGTGEGSPGDEVSISVFFDNNGAVGNFDIGIASDPGLLEVLDCRASVANLACSFNVNGEIVIVGQPTGGLFPDGEIAEILFGINEVGGDTTVPLPVFRENYFDLNGDSLEPGDSIPGAIFISGSGGGECSYDLQPVQSGFEAEGGDGTLTVNTPPNCGWFLDADQPWILEIDPREGAGTTNVGFLVDANESPTPRSGQIALFDEQERLVATHQIFQTGDFSTGGPGPGTIVGSGAGQPGDVVNIPVTYLGNSAVNNFRVQILFDPSRLDLGDFACRIDNANGDVGCGEVAPGVFQMAAEAGAPIIGGEVAFLQFIILPTVSPPDEIPLRLGDEDYSGPNGSLPPNGSQSGVIEVFGNGGCEFRIDPDSAFFEAAGGNGEIGVSAPGGCEWGAESSVPWIDLQNNSGVGDGTVRYTVRNNPNSTPRTGTIFVAGQLFSVVQEGAGGEGPAIQVGFASASPGEEVFIPLEFVNNGNVVTVQADIVFDPGRLNLAAVECGLGDAQASCEPLEPGLVRFLMRHPNEAPLPSGPFGILILRVQPGLGQQTIPINVASEQYLTADGGIVPPNGTSNGGVAVRGTGACEYGIDPESAAFPQLGGEGEVFVETSEDCGWSANATVDWIEVEPNFGGRGSGQVAYRVATNETGLPRSGALVVAGLRHAVSQAGGDAGRVPAMVVGSTRGVPGGLATVPLTFVNDGTVVQFSVEIVGDPDLLSVEAVECGFTDFPIDCSRSGNSSVQVEVPPRERPLPSGTFGAVTFHISEGASIPSEIPVIPMDERYVNANGNGVEPGSSVAGIISVVQNDLSDETFTLKEDSILEAFVGGADNADGDQFFRLFMGPEHGRLELAPDGFFIYQPEADFFGRDHFIYVQGDATGAVGGQARVDLIVNAVPDPVQDVYTMVEGTTLTGNVARNDDPGDEPATVSLEIEPANGDLELREDGSFTYEPDGPGTDTFLYQLTDADGDFGRPAQVTIRVVPDNDNPNIVRIDRERSLDAQIDEAIRTANGQNRAVRVQFPSGTYAYEGGVSNGSHAEPITRTVIFEPVGLGVPVTIQGTRDGRWLDVSGGAVVVNGLTLENFASSANGGIILARAGSTVEVVGARLRDSSAGDSGGAIHARTGSRLRILPSLVSRSWFTGNSAADGGGAIHLESGSTLVMSETSLTDNEAGNRGGALRLRDSATNPACAGGNCPLVVEILKTEFERNAASSGGAVDIHIDNGTANDAIRFDNVIFGDNTVTGRGCDVRIEDHRQPVDPRVIVFSHSAFYGRCESERIFSPAGGFTVIDSTLVHDGVAISADGQVDLSGNVISQSSLVDGVGKAAISKDLAKGGEEQSACSSTVGTFNSLGFNLSTDDSCDLSKATDQPNTNPMLTRSGKDFTMLGGSPMIDAAAAEMIAVLSGGSKELPCGYKDANGLGRPQDGDGDGGYECDIGNVEAKNGPDVQGAQSSAYFDPERPGEGVFIEVLDGGLIFSAMFTYQPDGSGPAWMVGVGQVSGNTMVMDEMLLTSGGTFGQDFDSNKIVRTPMGGMSMVFSECNSESKPGRMAFQASTGSPFADSLIQMQRLSNIVACGEETPAAKSGRSGSFYDPSRDGEGIFVQWLDDGRVVVIWYTFDPEGNQFWTISGEATVEGNMVTANMLYPASGTSFGLLFDPAEIVLENWGTLTLDYTNCNTMTFSYDSVVDGFGSGTYTYQRLTTLKDTTCDL